MKENIRNIIPSNCLAAFYYRDILKAQHQNPFIGTSIKLSDFIKLIQHWDTIDLKNIELIKTKFKVGKKGFLDVNALIVDNLITVHFVHEPLKENNDFIKEKWLRRVERNNEQPIFIYWDDSNCTDINIDEFIKLKTPYKKILYSNTDYSKYNSNNFHWLKYPYHVDVGAKMLNEFFQKSGGLFKYKNHEDEMKVGNMLELGIKGIVPRVNFLTVHYNTPILTEALVESINKHVANAHIYIFDNSDKKPFTKKYSNVTVLDNTKGEIINFDEVLSNYPNRHKSLGRGSKWGSFKHTISVDKCMDLIDDDFILMDSDTLLKKDCSDLIQENKIFIGQIDKWSWDAGQFSGKFPITYRVNPLITFINVKMSKENGVRYYNDDFMDGLYKKDIYSDSWDTGGYFWKISTEKNLPYGEIKLSDYVVHFKGASYKNGIGNSIDAFLSKYRNLYDSNPIDEHLYVSDNTLAFSTMSEPAFYKSPIAFNKIIRPKSQQYATVRMAAKHKRPPLER